MTQNPAINAATKLGQQWLPKVATWGLLGVSLWLIAGAVWFWIPRPDLPAEPVSLSNTQTSNTGAATANIGTLISRNLFGKPETKTQPKPQPSSTDAPDTRLNLKLAGIILSDNPDYSRALISGSDNKQKSYAIGDTIKGSSADVHEIHSDHVILERSGRYETLRLQKQVANAKNSSTRSSKSTPTTSSGVSTELKSVREQILKDPSKAGDFIRVRPVYSKGQLKGYRIYPGKDRALFRKVGLRSGDLVTSINGQNLNDPQKAFTMLSTLSSATSISLELQRRGRTETVSVDLGS